MNTGRLVTDTELTELVKLHQYISIPVPNTTDAVETCVACGHEGPCPTRRLVDEVRKLRDVDTRYAASLHEGTLRVHGGRHVC